MVLATDRADVNGVVRRRLDARKASFAAMDQAVADTGMEYGGITPIGLPPDWPVLVDGAVIDVDLAVIGSGVRRSKLALPGALLAQLPLAETLTLRLWPGAPSSLGGGRCGPGCPRGSPPRWGCSRAPWCRPGTAGLRPPSGGFGGWGLSCPRSRPRRCRGSGHPDSAARPRCRACIPHRR